MWFTGRAQILARLAAIDAKLDRLLTQENQTMIDVSALVTVVQQQTTVEKSALTLIQGMAAQQTALSKQLADAIAANDPAAIAAVQQAIDDSVRSLRANDTELAAAIAANTPATSAPPPSAGTPPPSGD